MHDFYELTFEGRHKEETYIIQSDSWSLWENIAEIFHSIDNIQDYDTVLVRILRVPPPPRAMESLLPSPREPARNLLSEGPRLL